MVNASYHLHQPYHPCQHQHPYYLVNPLHPHQILLLHPLLFIILEPSKIIQSECWSPGDHSPGTCSDAVGSAHKEVDTLLMHTPDTHY